MTRRELSSVRPQDAENSGTNPTEHRESPRLARLIAPRAAAGTAAVVAVGCAIALGVNAPSMLAAADATTAAPASSSATSTSVNLADSMNRSITGGLGTADLGGIWSTSGAAWSVGGHAGHASGVAPGTEAQAVLGGASVGDETAGITFRVPALPASGGGLQFSLRLRHQNPGSSYAAKISVSPDGTTTLSTVRFLNWGVTYIGTSKVMPTKLVAGTAYTMDAAVIGSTEVSTYAKLYPAGTPAPSAWQTQGNIAGVPAIATAGKAAFSLYVSSTSPASGVDVLGVTGSAISYGPPTSASSSPTSSAPTSPRSTPTSSSPSSTPTSSSPSSTPTTSVPTSPSSTPTTSVPTAGVSPSSTIGFGTGPTNNTPPTSTPPTSTPPTSTPPTSTPPTSTPPTSTPPTSTPPTSTPPSSGRAGASNTGVPAGITPTPYYGNLTITTPGTVINAMDVHGWVMVRADNVTIKNSILRGGVTGNGDIGMINNFANANLTVTDSEIVPEFPTIFSNGIMGQSMTVIRTNIHGTTDGIDVLGSNVNVVNSWIHDLVYYAHDPYQGGGNSHNDGIQSYGGSGLHVTGTTIERVTGSDFQLTQSRGLSSDVVWSGNYLNGGGCSLNFAMTPLTVLTGITVDDNRFGSDQTNRGCAVIAAPGAVLSLSGNVWDADGSPVVQSRG